MKRAAGARHWPGHRLRSERPDAMVRNQYSPPGLLLDELALAWLGTRVLEWRSILRISVPALGVLCAVGASGWEADASGGSAGEQARGLIAELGADASARELVGPATARATEALVRAQAAQGAGQAAALEEAALEWAQLAQDLKRARDAEQASDRLEQEVSSIQTELARSRAAVEQATARVGRAHQELTELQASAAPPRPGAAHVGPRASGAPR
jgi:hypothetical protein